MEGFIIFASVFFGIPLLIGLGFLIAHIKEEKRKKNVNAFYQTEEGKIEFQRIKKFHKRTGVSDRPDKPNCENVEKMLYDIGKYYEKRFLRVLEDAGFKLHTDVFSFGHICENDSYVYIYTDVFNCRIIPKFNKTGCYYEYQRSKYGLTKPIFSIATLIDFLESLENPDAIEKLVWKKIPYHEFYWYIECPKADNYLLGSLVLFGVLETAHDISKEDKYIKDNVKVFVGQKNGESWCIAKGEYDVKKMLEVLHCYAHHRKPDKYVPIKK